MTTDKTLIEEKECFHESQQANVCMDCGEDRGEINSILVDHLIALQTKDAEIVELNSQVDSMAQLLVEQRNAKIVGKREQS